MALGHLLRLLIAAAVGLGLFLSWSSIPFDLQTWQKAQAQHAEELSRAAAGSGQQLFDPATPTATPIPASSLTPGATSILSGTLTPTPTDVNPATDTPTQTNFAPTETTTPTGTTPTPTMVLPPLPTPGPTLAPPGTAVEQEITQSGGTVVSPDGRVVLDFPASAVSEDLTVRITNKDVTELPPVEGHQMLSTWQFEAFATDRAMAPITKFPDNIRVITNYALEDLFGLNPDTVRLWTWNQQSGFGNR